MPLHCSHNAFHGPYFTFNRFRQFVCAAIGGSFPPHEYSNGETWAKSTCDMGKYCKMSGKGPVEYFNVLPDNVLDPGLWYWGDEYNTETSPGLFVFCTQSDAYGNIAPEMCNCVADDLTRVLALIQKNGWPKGFEKDNSSFLDITKRFINGLRKASRTKKKGLTFC